MASVARVREDYASFPAKNEATSSAVSWAAVIAGAFVTAALSLILLALGTGIGLSSISPWANAGVSSNAVGRGAILWVIAMQIIASAIGGYLAGRLRTKWVDVHTHEVYFRDTAHGFLVWAVGLVITAAFLASAAASTAGGAAGSSPSGAVVERASSNPYFVDSLFRTDHPTTDANDSAVRTEAGVILANALRRSEMPQQDKMYLAQLVAAKTGITQPEAERRVSDTLAADQQAADEMRKSLAHSMYWTFLALLIGAFCASYAATIGGRQRDRTLAY